MRKLSKLLLALTFAVSVSTSAFAVVVASWGEHTQKVKS